MKNIESIIEQYSSFHEPYIKESQSNEISKSDYKYLFVMDYVDGGCDNEEGRCWVGCKSVTDLEKHLKRYIKMYADEYEEYSKSEIQNDIETAKQLETGKIVYLNVIGLFVAKIK